MRILLVIPPFTQLNTPYPSTAYLKSYLIKLGHQVDQIDLGLNVFLKVFSKEGLCEVKKMALKVKKPSERINFYLDAAEDYESTVGPVINFLQGKNPTIALKIANRQYLPEGPRFVPLDEYSEQLLGHFGELGTTEKAKYISSLFLDDIADIIQEVIDPDFSFSRYGEKLASSEPSFDKLLNRLKKNTLIDQYIDECLSQYIGDSFYELIGTTIPFPGNVLGALRVSSYIKKNSPKSKIVWGGGYVNTELRHLEDTRLFDFIDYLVFDDGERPFECLIDFLTGKIGSESLTRTWWREGKGISKSTITNQNVSFKNIDAPDYSGLPLGQYVSLLELPNPMHRLWSDFCWNKLILAHGCYWKKCTFCDVSLDYIERFEPQKASVLVDYLEKVIDQTGTSGFHFVDEAAPPTLLRALSKEIIERRLEVSWWGNLRFDALFDLPTAELMAKAGCIAVTGGLEVASPRILDLINKGISIEKTAVVTKNFSRSGIFVHCYLMYGFPSQTIQETIDSLEVVRQLFVEGCLHSAYWHRFSLTPHSPVGKNPENFGVKVLPIKRPPEGYFAINDLPYQDSIEIDLEMLGRGLNKALYNYMHQQCLNEDVRSWFEVEVPKTKIKKGYIKQFIN